MAKQQKKSTAHKAPRAAEPRMYGDGKPSQPAEAQQTAAGEPVKTATPTSSYSAGRTQPSRTAGATPRGAGATGSFARVDRITDYSYVRHDLRRLAITSAGILAGLIVLGLIVH